MEPNIDFKTTVSIILNNWTGLKIALENGMGGPPATMKKKLFSLIDMIYDTINSARNPNSLEWETISDILSDFLDDQMDTIFEDNSPDEVAIKIFEMYKLFSVQNQIEINNQIQAMKFKTPIVNEIINIHVNNLNADDEIMGTDSNEEDTHSAQAPPTQDEIDGWTIVTRGSKK